MTLSHSPKQNRILAGLPPAAYARLLPDLDLVSLPVGDGVYEPDIHITHLYFPVGCILARLYELESGASVKTSITGNEGMVGISYVLGSESTSARTVALNEGNAFRIKAPLLKKKFDCGGDLQRLLLRFAQAMIIQTEQVSIGNRHYTIEQRLCHFLLMILDRMAGNELHITHEQVGIFLEARRESITTAAQKLETTGAIECRRGHLTVVNRRELEEIASENYTVVSAEYERLLVMCRL
ncbi:MAG: Crp/Fnr family transcriptional regulator [Nitrosospira sp.]